MDSRLGWRWLMGLVLAAALAVGVGMTAYNAGVSHGLAAAGRTAALPPDAHYVVMTPHVWHGPGVFFPLFWLVLLFLFARVLFWGGPWRRGYGGYGGPHHLDEWHRRAHAGDSAGPERNR